MNLRADEFIFSKGKAGSGAEAFKRLGYDADELAVKLEKPSELFAEIIGKLQQLDTAAQIRIADEIFGGTGGEQFVKLIGQGEDGIRDAIAAAHDLGAVMDEELIGKAEELDRRFNDVATTVGTALKTAVVEAAAAMGQFWDRYQDFQDRATNSLKVRQAQLAHEHMELENKLQRWNSAPDSPYKTQSINELQRLIDANRSEDAEITRTLADRNPPNTTVLDPVTIDVDNGGSGGSRGGSSRERDRRSVERMIQALKDEQAMLQMTDKEKAAYNNLRRAGAAATDEERAAITQLTGAIYDQTEAQQQAEDAADFFRQTASDAFLALVPAIETGNAALDSLINKLIEAVAQAALLGDGPLAGFFGGGEGGGILGFIGSALGIPKNADGTGFFKGGPSIVGERGPELVNLPRGSQVIPNHRTRAMLSGGGSVINNNVSFGAMTVNVPEGTDPKDAAAMGRAFRKQIEATIDARLQENSRARGMLAGGPF